MKEYEPENTSFYWGIPRYWYSGMFDNIVKGSKYNGGGILSGAIVELDTVLSWDHNVSLTTTDPNYGSHSRKAWCPYWAGFWACRNVWQETDTVFVVKPTRGGDIISWDTIAFDYPNAYPVPDDLDSNQHIDSSDYPYSWCVGVVSSYSGDYYYVMFVDLPEEGVGYKYITCINAITGEMPVIPLVGDYLYISGYDTVGDTVEVYGIGGTPFAEFAPEDFGFGEMDSTTQRDSQCDLSDVSIENDIIDGPPFAIANANPVTIGSLKFIVNYLPGIDYSITTYDLSGRRMWSNNGVIIDATQEVNTSVSSWPTGMYFVVAQIGDEYYHESICIIH